MNLPACWGDKRLFNARGIVTETSTTPAPAKPPLTSGERRLFGWMLGLSLLFSAVAVFVNAFRWWLIDGYAGLIFIPFDLLPLPPLGLCLLASVVLLIKIRRGFRFVVPFLVCGITVILLAYVPFTRIWLNANFHWHRSDREAIVRDVQAGVLTPNVSFNSAVIELGDTRPQVSAGGNDIFVHNENGRTYILFLTFRGILVHYSGFLYVPDGGEPVDYEPDDPPREIERYDINWYFIAR